MTNDRTSAAHVLFDSIKSATDPVTRIRSFINSSPPTFEDERLDFKGAQDLRNNTALSDDKVKLIWSEALSAFANTGGGVLIWGIDARETNEVDAASGENLVQRPHAFTSRLKELLGGATDPMVSGVEYAPFVVDATKDEGFVVCLIPESRDVHSAEWAKNKPHMQRIGDKFMVMNNRVLRRLLYPQFSPNLLFTISTETSWQRVSGQPPKITIKLTIEVRNSGKGTAKDILVLIRPKIAPVTLVEEFTKPANATSNIAEWGQSNDNDRIACRAKNPLHPEVRSRITEFVWHHWSATKDGRYVPAFDSVELEFITYAENMPVRHCQAMIGFEALNTPRTIVEADVVE
jgi:hypothetical protein